MAEGQSFGEFNLYLPIGKYTMVVVAYSTNENSPFTLTSLTEAAFTGLRVRDTFVATQTVNVTSGNPLALSATLNRIVSQLTVTSTDGKAPNADKLRMTLSILGLFLVAFFAHADYGYVGYAFILMLYVLRGNPVVRAVVGCAALPSHVIGGMAFVPIALYNGKRGFIQGPVAKYLFYAFYPLHMLVIWFLRTH